ncbi:extracellular solute-binding protein [Georgenia sp. TF02-10]|uniref:ABC transporter substrate-binding protein n=1 Tax=Georgenia sp. TF02-10 TaxID=2917725 RepID=UPI001FA7482A|nr:extracellular solute-binding protein [Georgenia sp. TF02-10]UNX55799.1 extracellular solute-binding protein [Georgenia sp. TF02-10]
MRKMNGRKGAVVASTAALALVLTACGGSSGEGDEEDAGGTVQITVSGLPDNTKPEERQAFLDDVAAFEDANPGIDVEPTELLWDQQTFSAQLAGGTLPTLMAVPFTELPGLINRQQVKDVTEWVQGNDLFGDVSESVLQTATGPDGNIYGIPLSAYSIGLIIHRDIFEEAGLDPDQPLESWDDVAEAARTITGATGKQGFALPATETYGGWLLSAAVNGFGGDIQRIDGDEVHANLDSEAVQQAMEWVHEMRWEHQVMGTNALPSQNDINNAFAAGDVAMLINGGDAYQPFTVQLGVAPESFGTFPMPQDSDGLGTSGGGRIGIVRPDATDEQVDAVLKWVEFRDYQRYSNEEAAVAWAEARAADGLPVPEVGFPMVGQATWEQFLEWVEPYSNVPLENVQSYLDSASTLQIVPEPTYAGHDMYALLDTVIQAVLSREDADIPALLATAQEQAEAAVQAAQG